MKLLVGLGNPGKKYDRTRHNVGFKIVDRVAEKAGINIEKKKFASFFGKGEIEGCEVCIVKPQTYMNLSGESVRDFAGYFKIGPEDILVTHDDIDLPFAKLRISFGSGAGGHNGISSVIDHLGTNEFFRLKVGVGRPAEGVDPADHVLTQFDTEEKAGIARAVDAAVSAIFEFYGSGVEKAKIRLAGLQVCKSAGQE